MAISSVQISLSAIKGTLEHLRENAQNIASTIVSSEQPNTTPEVSPSTLVLEVNQTDHLQNRTKFPDNNSRIVSALVSNIELEQQSGALVQTIKIADKMLGTALNIGTTVNTKA